MTREEAKKILEAYIACESKKAHFECDDDNCDDNCYLLYEMGTVGEYNEAINIAIQALEQESIDKSAMMYEIYMNGVNMSGEFQGCWVRFKDIKKIVDEYMAESED